MEYDTKGKLIRGIKARHDRELPLNISAVAKDEPELLAAAYSFSPFLGWKQALELAGLSYGTIFTHYGDEVECRVCGETFGSLSNHLIQIHQVTPEEYREEFPDAEIICEVLRFRKDGVLSRHPDRIPDWEPALSFEFALDKVNEYRKQGFYLNYVNMMTIDFSICKKLTAEFELSWDEVMETVGVDPRTHRRTVKADDYTMGDLRDWLKNREEAGLKNTVGAVATIYQDSAEGPDNLRHRIVAWAMAFHDRSWDKVLAVSGVDLSHPAYNERNFPDAQSIIDAIVEIRDAGRPTGFSDVILNEEDSKIAFAAPRYFGNWTKALEAAGVAAIYEERKLYSREGFVKHLEKRFDSGFPLDVLFVYFGTRRDQPLFKAAFEYFPSWRAAVKEVSGNNRRLVADAAKGNPFSTKKKVIAELQRLHQAGELASERKMEKTPRFDYLNAMAHGFFRGWRKAARAAGIDPKSYHDFNRNPIALYPTKEEVVEAIVKRRKEGRPLNARSVATGEEMDVPLIYSARKLFGSWEDAIEAAGLDYGDFVRKKQDYSVKREYTEYNTMREVILGIRKRAESGLKLNSRALQHGEFSQRDNALIRVGRQMFGTWEKALSVAGLNPDKILLKKQDPEKTKGKIYATYKSKPEVIAEIKKRKRSGKALNSRALQHGEDEVRDFGLWKSSRKLFGTWEKALEEAGIDLLTVYPEWQLKRMKTFQKKREAKDKESS